MVPLIQQRIKTLSEAASWLDFFFQEYLEYDANLLIGKKMDVVESQNALRRARITLADLAEFSVEVIEPALRELAENLGLKVGQLLGIIRVAVSGKKVAPPLFETLAILGQERTLARMDRGLDALARLGD
jgi:glutamyl-tRNA synthetase